MSNRSKRTTRTVRLSGGPLDGTLVQMMPEHPSAAFATEGGNREVYIGTASGGYGVFQHAATLDENGQEVKPA
jgi:hypothetical protein